ncbi:MAG TPA: Uma2 family endonuclease [Pseudonocardiaceae bacterium]
MPLRCPHRELHGHRSCQGRAALSGHDHSKGAPWGHGHWAGRLRSGGGVHRLAKRGDLLAVEGGEYLAAPPALFVEVLSPSTRRIDRLSKLSAYEEAGVPSYWLVDPDPETPSLHALDLVDGHYVEVGCPSGEQVWQALRPFPVSVTPADTSSLIF